MPMTNRLLNAIFFGNELEKFESGMAKTLGMIRDAVSLPEEDKIATDRRVVTMAANYQRARNKGRFGGQITAGDAAFIAGFLNAVRPDFVLELGVCSGQSSGFILVAADRLGLLRPDVPFLTSVDAVAEFGPDRLRVGQVVEMNFPHRLSDWQLLTGTTMLDALEDGSPIRQRLSSADRPLVFIDAEHRHPWPLIDIAICSLLLPEDAWILIQDIRLVERWLANTIERGVPCPSPERGVDLAFSHWPGTKLSGVEMAYNMAALKNDVSAGARRSFFEMVRSYPHEFGPSADADVEIEGVLSRVANALSKG